MAINELTEAKLFKDRKEWREWLEKNHKIKDGVWLIHYKVKLKKESVSHKEAVEEALCFGWIDSKLKSVDEDRYILRYTSRKGKSVWSKINKDAAEKMIFEGKMTEAGFEKINIAKKQGLWESAYTNLIKERMPSDLKKAFLKNKEAWKNFKNFANSYRNSYIGWVKGAKSDETRKRRIKVVVKRSELNKKPGVE
jgi:uncharacterized protein YdeI (YjbR/CyaY-like superfamily)